jgi:hypothetical protein
MKPRAVSFLAMCALICGCAGDTPERTVDIRRDVSTTWPRLNALVRDWKQAAYQADWPDAGPVLLIDLEARQVGIEGTTNSVVTLPAGYKWTTHHVTPGKKRRLPDRIRLLSRHWKGGRNACPEIFHIQGTADATKGIYFYIGPGKAGAGTGVGLLDTYTFDTPSSTDKSMLLPKE